jgi:hypothetical protein
MSRRATGVVFCFIAALLFSTRYLAAAIFGSGVSSWDAQLFRAMLEYVGQAPSILAAIALAVGIIYLAWAEIAAWRGGS